MVRSPDSSPVVSCLSRRFVAIVAVLGLLWSWAGSSTAMVPAHRAPERTATTLQPWGTDDFVAAAPTAVETSIREEGSERLESSDGDGGPANANEASESGPNGELWDGTGSVRISWGSRTRLRRHFDPFVGQCCVRLSPTRAPPAAASSAA